MSTDAEFRRYPKNTWRLVKLRERYLSLRFAEDTAEEQQFYNQLHHTHQSLRMKKSTDQLRNHLMENRSALDLNTDKKHSNFIHTPASKSTVDSLDQDSISSVPSLTSQSTVSPMSPNMTTAFTFQAPSVRLEESHSTPLKFTQ